MKRILSLLSAAFVVATLCSSVPAYADDAMTAVDESIALEMGERFFDGVSPEEDLEARDAVQLYGVDGKPIGFVVHGYTGQTRKAYVVFDKNEEMGVAEFGLGETAKSPAEATTDKEIVGRSVGTEVLYRLDYTGYATIDLVSGSGYDNAGMATNQEIAGLTSPDIGAMRSAKPEKWDDLMMNLSTVYRDYDIALVNAVSGATAFSEITVEKETSRYACAVSAMLTVCSYYVNTGGLSALKANYLNLWSLSNTVVDHTSGQITFGTTKLKNIGPAVQSFCKSKGRSISFKNCTVDSWSNYKATIDSGNMAITRGDCNGGGHGMAVVGYLRLLDKNNKTNQLDTLMVYDGWTTEQRVLSYYSPYYQNKASVQFS